MSDKMSPGLAALKAACQQKKFTSFSDLKPGEYIVKSFSVCNTKYGSRIRIDLSHTYLLLPERFTQLMSPDVMNDVNANPKMMIYKGRDPTKQNRLVTNHFFFQIITIDFFLQFSNLHTYISSFVCKKKKKNAVSFWISKMLKHT